MPYRDPAWWRDVAHPFAGGLIAMFLVAFQVAAAPRPWPEGHMLKGSVETLAALVVGTLAGIYLGPLVAQLTHVAGEEAIGGVKMLVAVVGWRALPILMDVGLKLAKTRAEKVG